ncbi:rhodanese-like domain-containing protein [Fluviicola taffensis]|uniref:Rhodanese-like protein n=1 Tax=Fluviicola taffensis (strain DSM 16823 / NCIMB 13979 / RW262) TaxID=755732 RepID=F2IJT4_FLUTR|nr:Rhodanese-like protein [Fluviicola taffensis DSM 16823]
MGFLQNILGLGPKADYKDLMTKGALIVDVRSKGEFQGGHIRGSINIPLDQLRNELAKLPKKDRTIITCCASGMRSASAKTVLESNGYADVHNGGGWSSLQNKLKV